MLEVDILARIFTRKEVRQRKMKYEVFAGMFDFIGILVGLVVTALCLLLLSSLYHWVIQDVESSFATLWDIFMSAIIIPE